MDELKDFSHITEIEVKWGEMDAFGHVNNIIFFRYFEDARIKYFIESGMMEIMKKMDLGPILASVSCRYHKPLFYPDTVSVGTRVQSCGKSSVVMEHLILSPKSGLVAKGEGVIVAYDYHKSIKTEIDETIKNSIIKFEGREIDSCDVELDDI